LDSCFFCFPTSKNNKCFVLSLPWTAKNSNFLNFYDKYSTFYARQKKKKKDIWNFNYFRVTKLKSSFRVSFGVSTSFHLRFRQSLDNCFIFGRTNVKGINIWLSKIDRKIKNKNDILILNRHKNRNVRLGFQWGFICDFNGVAMNVWFSTERTQMG
jgi:hypothetical protein